MASFSLYKVWKSLMIGLLRTFRSLNQKDWESLKQIMMKKNRVEHIGDLGCEKRILKCRNCNQQGHNIKPCTEKCGTCVQ